MRWRSGIVVGVTIVTLLTMTNNHRRKRLGVTVHPARVRTSATVATANGGSRSVLRTVIPTAATALRVVAEKELQERYLGEFGFPSSFSL